MTNLKQIFKFGWPYLKRYRRRLFLGIMLAVFFGASNASFVWATKTLFDRMAPKDPPPQVIVVNDFDWKSFAARLKNPALADELSRYLMNEKLAPATRKLLADDNGAVDLSLRQALADDLSQIILTNRIYDPQRFAGVTISRDTAAMLDKNPQGTADLARLNRKLLLDAYPKPMAPLALAAQNLQKAANHLLDPWLPMRGRPLDIRQMVGGLLLLPILVFFRSTVGYLSVYSMNWVSERVIKDLRLDLLIKLNSLSMDFFNRSTMGDLLGRVNGDTAALYRCMSMGFTDLVREPVTVVCIGLALLWIDWKLTLLAVAFVPFIIIPIRVLGKKAKKAFKSSVKAGISQDSLLVEVYASIRVVKAFCLEPFQIERFRAIYHSLVSTGMRGMKSRELINPIIEVISVMGLSVVIIFVSATHREIPNMVGFLTGVVLLYAPIKKLSNLPVFFQQAAVGSERLIQLFNEMPSVVERADAAPLKDFARELKFENVNFAYGEKLVLRDFNLSIPRGFRLGVAGESGSGKSTMTNLVFRFYDPVSGSIKIDGHDLRDVSLADLRRQMALVSQDIVLFDMTVAENIGLGRPGATRAEIEAAARASYAHEFIMQLPNGYDSRIGESGKLLSGGQRQRVCIARAFVRNAPILVLDEVTGNLDSNAEAEVQKAIDRLEEDRTVICVAHRLSTLANTDGIIVLSEGRIVEQGHYKELLRSNGIFAGLARKQGISH
jgi:ABC-type multidrug transport system fused ATPase/permease subunit